MKYKNLHLIYGPMYSGKSKKLIETYQKKITNKLIFKPKADTKNREYVKSRDGQKVKAISLEKIEEVYDYLNEENLRFLFFDEVFMFKGNLEKTFIDLLEKKYEIFISTLDMDFKGQWFGNVKNLFSYAFKYKKEHLFSKCHVCGNPSAWSIRIVNEKIAKEDSPIILVDNKIKMNIRYETRCDKHKNVIFTKIDYLDKELLNEIQKQI
ncbi:MAG: thymidine kinase [Candidatus Hepatoplasma vulgare]|nr:MAG: thymidine kinase [Candidatus Hepatoplasma sp.]